jgi:threonine/homoserine/homoserine lactone efflux protein
LPQFIDSNAGVTLQLWVLGATFVTMAIVNATLYAACAGSARRLLSSPKAQLRFNLAGGSLMSVAGVWAILAKRPA